MHLICVGLCTSPLPCAVPLTPLVLFHTQQSYNARCPPSVSKKQPDSYLASLMASSCWSVISPLKAQFLVKSVLTISHSTMGLSVKLEQLDSPSSVSDLRELLTTDEIFICFNLLYKICPCDSGNAYHSFLLLWIVIGISRVFNKTQTQTPPLVIENELPEIAAPWLFGFGITDTCLLSVSSQAYYCSLIGFQPHSLLKKSGALHSCVIVKFTGFITYFFSGFGMFYWYHAQDS